jgi:cyanophycin synthetase
MLIGNELRWILLRSTALRMCRRYASVMRRLTRARDERSLFYSEAWRSAAAELGVEVRALRGGALELSLGSKRFRVRDNCVPIDAPDTLARAGDKELVYRLLAREGLPVPPHLRFRASRFEPALEFLAARESRCVVKPCCGTGAGAGVTTGIRNRDELLRAIPIAGAHSGDLLIESEVPGRNFRILLLAGRLVDAIERRPPALSGDGRTTIAQLLARANAERQARGRREAQVLIGSDLDMQLTLARQGLSLDAIPEAGREVVLKTVINDNSGRENLSALSVLCPEIIDSARRAAAAVGSELAGIDIITGDPSRPLAETGGVVLEVNTTPGYYYHYHQREGPVRVAAPVLRHLFGIRANA